MSQTEKALITKKRRGKLSVMKSFNWEKKIKIFT